MDRRTVMAGLAGSATQLAFPLSAHASVPAAYDWNATPPFDSRQAFVEWMVKSRGEDPVYCGERYDRLMEMVAHHDVWDARTKRAFSLVPRERFVTAPNLARTYQVHYLDIGYGVTITGPNTVSRMTNTIDVQRTDRVLEIGTGSGYQSALLANRRTFVVEPQRSAEVVTIPDAVSGPRYGRDHPKAGTERDVVASRDLGGDVGRGPAAALPPQPELALVHLAGVVPASGHHPRAHRS